jgi:type VI secretion system protein VasD
MQINPIPSAPLSRPSARSRTLWVAAAALVSLYVAGCGSKPVAALVGPSKTTLVSTVIVGPNANPDGRKRPSPMVVRMYELKSTALFESTDFVSLFEKDQASLGTELLSREEVNLRPNDVKAMNKTLSPDAKFIGVVVAFRELERARWRVFVPIVPGKKNVVKIRVDDVNVKIDREEP